MLKIKNLHANLVEENLEIIKGLNLELEEGKVHAIMGPNGSGKSTLSKLIAGDENYEITKGSIEFKSQSIEDLNATDRRTLSGLFLAFQYPVEIPGVNNAEFLRMAYNAKQKHNGDKEADPIAFNDILQSKIKDLNIPEEFLDRVKLWIFWGRKKE